VYFGCILLTRSIYHFINSKKSHKEICFANVYVYIIHKQAGATEKVSDQMKTKLITH